VPAASHAQSGRLGARRSFPTHVMPGRLFPLPRRCPSSRRPPGPRVNRRSSNWHSHRTMCRLPPRTFPAVGHAGHQPIVGDRGHGRIVQCEAQRHVRAAGCDGRLRRLTDHVQYPTDGHHSFREPDLLGKRRHTPRERQLRQREDATALVERVRQWIAGSDGLLPA
jgi:hypothetical protein